MNEQTLKDLVRDKAVVRAYSGGDELICEGRVVAVCMVPTIIIEEDVSGRVHHVASTLRVERQCWEKL